MNSRIADKQILGSVSFSKRTSGTGVFALVMGMMSMIVPMLRELSSGLAWYPFEIEMTFLLSQSDLRVSIVILVFDDNIDDSSWGVGIFYKDLFAVDCFFDNSC